MGSSGLIWLLQGAMGFNLTLPVHCQCPAPYIASHICNMSVMSFPRRNGERTPCLQGWHLGLCCWQGISEIVAGILWFSELGLISCIILLTTRYSHRLTDVHVVIGWKYRCLPLPHVRLPMQRCGAELQHVGGS